MPVNDLLPELQTSFHSSTGFSAVNGKELDILTEFLNRESELKEQSEDAEKLLRKESKEIGNANGNDPFLRSAEGIMEQAEKKIAFVRKELTKMQDENNELELEYVNEYPGKVRVRLVQFPALLKVRRSQVDMLRTLSEEVQPKLRSNYKEYELEVDLESNTDIVQVVGDSSRYSAQIEYLEERKSKIKGLTKNILEGNNLSHELALVVEKQQGLIQDIEYKIKNQRRKL